MSDLLKKVLYCLDGRRCDLVDGNKGDADEWIRKIDNAYSDYVDGGEENNDWISVDDRLPDLGQTVDVYMKKKRFACNRLTDVRWMKSLNKFRATRTGRHYNLEQISHWMPLPEPPTK